MPISCACESQEKEKKMEEMFKNATTEMDGLTFSKDEIISMYCDALGYVVEMLKQPLIIPMTVDIES